MSPIRLIMCRNDVVLHAEPNASDVSVPKYPKSEGGRVTRVTESCTLIMHNGRQKEESMEEMGTEQGVVGLEQTDKPEDRKGEKRGRVFWTILFPCWVVFF